MSKLDLFYMIFIAAIIIFIIFVVGIIVEGPKNQEPEKTYTVTVDFQNEKNYQYHPYKNLTLISSRDRIYRDNTTMKLIQFNCPFIAEQD